MFDELSELSHNKLQYVIDSYLLWVDRSTKIGGTNRRRSRIVVEEQIDKVKELIEKVKTLNKCYL